MDSHAILASYFSRTTATKVANLGERRLPQFGHATTTPKWSTVMLSWVRVTSQIDPNGPTLWGCLFTTADQVHPDSVEFVAKVTVRSKG